MLAPCSLERERGLCCPSFRHAYQRCNRKEVVEPELAKWEDVDGPTSKGNSYHCHRERHGTQHDEAGLSALSVNRVLHDEEFRRGR